MNIDCSNCKLNSCYQGQGCSKNYDFTHLAAATRKYYGQKQVSDSLIIAGKIETDHYMQWTRLEEIIGYCGLMRYKTIGIAMCLGLVNEAETLVKILSKHFSVHSICCKNSGIDKKDYGITQIDESRYESSCNPIGQALLLNELGTEINIVVGLCIGHDIMFNKYSNAPCTTFVVKDRVLAHNPVAVLYSGYHRNRLMKNK
ncbi:MAG: DUF1847 domain-containing protein [Desulfuromonadales bacterium]